MGKLDMTQNKLLAEAEQVADTLLTVHENQRLDWDDLRQPIAEAIARACLFGRIEGYGRGSNDAVHRDCCGVGTWLEEQRAQLAALEKNL
jgi:hypothetical protein